jgi:PAS domain S-box-containing protein
LKTNSMSSGSAETSADFLLGGGEMGVRMREMDWAATSLGLVDGWPQSLRSALSICLNSRFPIAIYWGPEYVLLYNDAWRPIAGNKHPEVLGLAAHEVWPEIWDIIGPMLGSVSKTGEATWRDDQLLPMNRFGYTEECYFDYTFSPIRGQGAQVEGVFNVVTETTYRSLNDRRNHFLRELGTKTAAARSAGEACRLAATAIAADPHDLPFALLYLIDPDARQARLAGAAGLDPGEPAAPLESELDASSPAAVWPLLPVVKTGQAERVTDLIDRFGALPGAPWPETPREALVLPLTTPGQSGGVAGVLIAGVSPRRALDDNYRDFFERAAGHIAASIANARTYEEERRRAEALAEIDRAKTAFFSNVSHEFRTPLTLMLGPLDDILAKPEEEIGRENRGILSLVYRNGQRLLKLVNTLLDFSRIEAGRVQAVYEPIDLATYTAELASVFRAAVEKAGLRLVIDCPPLPEPVFVDRDLWEKIVLNLVSNAFKYTLAGEIRVSLRPAADQRSAVLAVQDTGTGIPEAELPKIFNRFHRVQETRGRTHEGTGIGLALVLELVKLHGGTVGVDSVYGAGSTFTVAVPFGPEHLPAERVGGARTQESTALGASPFVEEALRWLPGALPAGPRDTGAFSIQTGILPAARPAAPGNRPTVVLADDNADMRDYVGRLLSTAYRVIAVADGAEALRATIARKPDLVITDVMMPRLDGFGLLKALREDPGTASTPIIMLSARAGEEARVEGLQAGADDYLTKPFSARELLARVGGTLALARARREAMRREEDLKAETTNVLESIAEGFVSLDHDFRINYVNAEAERLNGMRREKMIGKTHWEVFPAVLGTRLEMEFRRAMAERVPVKFENLYEPWERWFEIDVYPTPTGGLAVYFRDITERKLAMEALQEADRRKDEFLATLAHELRNPLAPIRNGLQILRLGRGNHQAEERARAMIERQVQQMVRLIDDLLDLSRISRGKIELRRERIDLAAAVQSAVETSRPLIEQSGHALTLSLPPEPVFVDADVTRLAQVFANLLNNAAKYTQRGGGDIHLTVEPLGHEVAVRVRDNGVGIPAPMLPHIFEMFTQVDRSLERTQGGLGIGLSIVKRLAEMHGGTVKAYSEGLGRGSEFVVRLPVLTPAAQEPGPRSGGEEPAGAAVRRRILVADDNVDSAESLAMMLEFMGNEVRTAHDGAEAAAAAAAFRPDIILLDIGMPRMNGYDACRRIREQPWGRGIAIAALTGWGQEEDKRQSREAGFDHHLVKPVEPAALEKLLASVQAGTA